MCFRLPFFHIHFIWNHVCFHNRVAHGPDMCMYTEWWCCCCSVCCCCCCCCLLLLFVMVYLPPKLFFIQTTVLTANLFLLRTSILYLAHPLAAQWLLCGLGLYQYFTSHGHYAHTRSRRRASVRRDDSPLVHKYIPTRRVASHFNRSQAALGRREWAKAVLMTLHLNERE